MSFCFKLLLPAKIRIHNIAFTSAVLVWNRSEICTDQAKQICGWILMSEIIGVLELFHLRMSYYRLWTHILALKCIDNGFFFTNMQLLSSQGINWWTGMVWITCGLLWCFWRHPFTAEDPLLWKWRNASDLMKKQTHLHLGWPVYSFKYCNLDSDAPIYEIIYLFQQNQ